jgi:hypothetical protein
MKRQENQLQNRLDRNVSPSVDKPTKTTSFLRGDCSKKLRQNFKLPITHVRQSHPWKPLNEEPELLNTNKIPNFRATKSLIVFRTIHANLPDWNSCCVGKSAALQPPAVDFLQTTLALTGLSHRSIFKTPVAGLV